MKRRTFIVSLLWAAAGGGAVVTINRLDWHRPLEVKIAMALSDGRYAGKLGRVYLDEFPADRDLTRLIDLLFPDLARRPAPVQATALAESLAKRVRQDFVDGNVVSLEGWLLARTEARICALLALA